jgi:hypothetical protein
MTAPKKTRPPAGHGKRRGTRARPTNGPPENHDWRNDNRVAQAIGENIDWLAANKAKLLQDHPDWANKYVAVSSRTPSKVLAMSEDRSEAFLEALKSAELLDLAKREGMPPGCLVNPMLLEFGWVY